jgi:hypothetical protein
MERLEEYRALALQELRALMTSDTPLLVDALLDDCLRHAKGLRSRPESAEPYTRLFTLTDLPKIILQDFRGDVSWVHNQEGHAGKAYWPGGESGVTLDPGVDLGHTAPVRVKELYAGILSSSQLAALESCYKKFGLPAQKLLADGVISSVRVTFAQGVSLMPYAAQPYWETVTGRFCTLLEPSTPASVQTVFLSLAYNRGPSNPQLAFLRGALEKRDWKELAKQVGNMQQDHVLPGIRKRRKLEAQLIRDELGIK